MKSITSASVSALLALSILAGIAGHVSADEASPNDAKFLEQLDRESRGGQGQ